MIHIRMYSLYLKFLLQTTMILVDEGTEQVLLYLIYVFHIYLRFFFHMKHSRQIAGK